ncbi:MAG TPA: LL-diaminopimelate aminotransferase [Rubrivivax sp.]|nr:LL-diaminopimelate aminotransferase [Rubrivivax sp.]
MIRVNPHHAALPARYLFAEVADRVRAFRRRRPEVELISLGIGDVTEPLPPACIRAFHAGVDELAAAASFRGYGPEQGYDFLREAIARHDFQAQGVHVDADEVFVSDGSKCDIGNFQELFATDIRVAIPDPVYPVYVDTNLMAGRVSAGKGNHRGGLVDLPCPAANGYAPQLPQEPVDLIYLCSPNNPTGATMTRPQLQQWVEYARAQRALILFDAAYEAFIRDDALPHSIYEIPGARELAVEFRSYSKTAGFTGVRCAYTVVPRDCGAWQDDGTRVSLHGLWNRRQSTKFNGVSYPVQRAAEAIYTPQGRQQVRALADGYLANARIIREGITSLGLRCAGGDNSPYVWIDAGRDSWEFFGLLLEQAGVVCTPGAGFGPGGRGHVRISAFNQRARVELAMQRIAHVLG